MKNLWWILLILSALPNAFGQRIIPHVTQADGMFETHLLVHNQSALSKPLTLIGYDVDGNQLETVRIELQGGELRNQTVFSLMPVETSHVHILGSERVKVTLAYAQKNQERPVTTFTREIHQFSTHYQLYPSDRNPEPRLWAGVALTSLSGQDQKVIIEAKNTTGQTLWTRTENLSGNAKRLALLETIVDTQTGSQPAAYFLVSGENPFALTALSGEAEQQLMWQVQTVTLKTADLAEITRDDPSSLERDPFDWKSAELTEEMFEAQIVLSDGCPTTTRLFMTPEVFMESNPVQANLYLQLVKDDNGPCPRVITTRTIQFDLSPIVFQYLASNQEEGVIILNVLDQEGSIFKKLTYRPLP